MSPSRYKRSIANTFLGELDCSVGINDALAKERRGGWVGYLFPSRLHASPHISARQYARLVHRWVESIGLESASYGTHSMRRTKAAQICRKTGNLRAVQLLLGHTKLDYLGIEVDDVLNSAEQIEL